MKKCEQCGSKEYCTTCCTCFDCIEEEVDHNASILAHKDRVIDVLARQYANNICMMNVTEEYVAKVVARAEEKARK